MIDICVNGIPCEFNENALDDYEMLEKMYRMQDGDIIAMVGFANGIFGEEQVSNIKSQLRGDDGVVHLKDMSDFINESLVAASKAKKAEAKN